MNKNMEKLIKELELSGASDKESEELSLLSKNLSNLYDFKRSDYLKRKFLYGQIRNTSFYNHKKAFAVAFLSLFLLLGFTLSASAQKSLPGEPLYPLKRLSESAISLVNPSFKGEILQRRSQEIKSLSKNKNYNNISQTIKDYENNLDDNKSISKEEIESSRKNLEEAKTDSGSYQDEIQNAINKTEQKQNEEVKGDRTVNLEENKNGRDNSSSSEENH